MFLQRQFPKKAGKEKLHFGLFLGLLFCSIITLKPLKTLCFRGFSVISQGLKEPQKIHFLRFRDLHTRMTVNQAKYRRKDRLALTTTRLQSSAFQGNFLWFGGDFIEQIWAALEIPFRWRKWMCSILLWTDRRDSWFSIGSFFPPLQTGSRTVWIPCRESLAQRKMGAFCPHSRTVISYLCKSSCFPI